MHRKKQYERVAYKQNAANVDILWQFYYFVESMNIQLQFFFVFFPWFAGTFVAKPKKWSTTSDQRVLCITKDTCAPFLFDPILLVAIIVLSSNSSATPLWYRRQRHSCWHRLRLRLCTSPVIFLSYIFYRCLRCLQYVTTYSGVYCSLNAATYPGFRFVRSYVIYCLHEMRLHWEFSVRARTTFSRDWERILPPTTTTTNKRTNKKNNAVIIMFKSSDANKTNAREKGGMTTTVSRQKWNAFWGRECYMLFVAIIIINFN